MAKVRSSNPFPALERHKNMNLATFRKSGEPVATSAWYVILDGKLYVRTGTGTGKVRRIRNNPRVLLTPATVWGKKVGPESEARARILGSRKEELAGKCWSRCGTGTRRHPLWISSSATKSSRCLR